MALQNPMFRTPGYTVFFPRGFSTQKMIRVIESKIIWKWSEGIKKLHVRLVSGRFELSRVRYRVTEGINKVNVWRKSRGNRFWFELARGSSYRESAVRLCSQTRTVGVDANSDPGHDFYHFPWLKKIIELYSFLFSWFLNTPCIMTSIISPQPSQFHYDVRPRKWRGPFFNKTNTAVKQKSYFISYPTQSFIVLFWPTATGEPSWPVSSYISIHYINPPIPIRSWFYRFDRFSVRSQLFLRCCTLQGVVGS